MDTGCLRIRLLYVVPLGLKIQYPSGVQPRWISGHTLQMEILSLDKEVGVGFFGGGEVHGYAAGFNAVD
jgi:hypothetical protein